MTDALLIYLASVLFIISIVQENGLYRSTGFFITFTILAVSISKDLTQIFITIIGGLAVHILMVFSMKEYIKLKK